MEVTVFIVFIPSGTLVFYTIPQINMTKPNCLYIYQKILVPTIREIMVSVKSFMTVTLTKKRSISSLGFLLFKKDLRMDFLLLK